MCSSGRRSGSGRGPKNVTPSERLLALAPPGDGRGQAVDLWWFLLGCFRFLEPLAPSNQQQHGSQRLRTRPQSSISLLCSPPSRRSQTSLTSLRVRFRELHDGRGRGTVESCMVADIVVCGVATQPIRSGSGGVSRVFHIPGPTPTWCDLWRCREMITKLHFEGVRRGIPGPTPSTGTNPTTGRGVSPRHPGRRLPRIFT